MRPRARLKILKSGFTALREGHALLLGMKPPWLRRTRRKKINGWWYGHGAHLVTWPAVNAVALSKGPARLLATQPKDFPFQVSVMLSVFTFKCFFFRFHCQGFRLFVSLLNVKVKKTTRKWKWMSFQRSLSDWPKNTAGNCPTLSSVSGPECWLVAKTKQY